MSSATNGPGMTGLHALIRARSAGHAQDGFTNKYSFDGTEDGTMDAGTRTNRPAPLHIGSRFDSSRLDALPMPAVTLLRHAIAPGARLPGRVSLTMHGHIKIVGAWLPFTADQVIELGRGFSWTASIAGGLIRGTDSLSNEQGATRFGVGGRIPLVSANGPDVNLSALGRFVAEQAAWMPGSLLPTAGTHWSVVDANHVVATVPAAGGYTRLHLGVAPDGALRDLTMSRWGPSHGHFAWMPFGMHADAEATFGDFTVVSQGRVGWWYGTRRWPTGEFFRFVIDDLHAL
jgi:hypothetical protein